MTQVYNMLLKVLCLVGLIFSLSTYTESSAVGKFQHDDFKNILENADEWFLSEHKRMSNLKDFQMITNLIDYNFFIEKQINLSGDSTTGNFQ